MPADLALQTRGCPTSPAHLRIASAMPAQARIAVIAWVLGLRRGEGAGAASAGRLGRYSLLIEGEKEHLGSWSRVGLGWVQCSAGL